MKLEKLINEAYDNNLDKIWVIHMFTDSHDTEDGAEDLEFTKIGLIDYLNEYYDLNINYEISDMDLKDYIAYLGDDAQLLEIK